VAGGAQYVSWIHESDFVRAVVHLIEETDIEGPVNLAAPNPLPQREFMAALRSAWGRWLGLPATAWMAETGAFFLRTDTELLLKSRRVVPGRLLASGFEFEHAQWSEAARGLTAQWREARATRDRDAEPAETSLSAALKGATVAFAAHALFCVGYVALAGRFGADSLENLRALGVLMGFALLPTLLVGAGLGWLARQLRRARALSLAIVAMLAVVLVFILTFGVFMGLALALIFSVALAPIAIVSAVALAWWVRPSGVEAAVGAPTGRGRWCLGAQG